VKTAIIILSDPKGESEESLGRVFNGLAAAYDYKSAGKEVSILFQGAGTRWPEVLQKENHPAHELFEAVADKIQGVSCACADVFGADTTGYDLIKDNKVPKTTGLPSLSNLQDQGFNVLTF
jgi:hypothetical protein